jgi:hypothetical protein
MCVRLVAGGLLAVEGTIGLLLLQATGCSSTYKPKTSGIGSSEQVNCVLYYFLSL